MGVKKTVSGAAVRKDALKGEGPKCQRGHDTIYVKLVKPRGRARLTWWCPTCICAVSG